LEQSILAPHPPQGGCKYTQGDLHTGAAVDLIMRRVLTWSRLVTSALPLIDTSPAQREAWRDQNGKKRQKSVCLSRNTEIAFAK